MPILYPSRSYGGASCIGRTTASRETAWVQAAASTPAPQTTTPAAPESNPANEVDSQVLIAADTDGAIPSTESDSVTFNTSMEALAEEGSGSDNPGAPLPVEIVEADADGESNSSTEPELTDEEKAELFDEYIASESEHVVASRPEESFPEEHLRDEFYQYVLGPFDPDHNRVEVRNAFEGYYQLHLISLPSEEE